MCVYLYIYIHNSDNSTCVHIYIYTYTETYFLDYVDEHFKLLHWDPGGSWCGTVAHSSTSSSYPTGSASRADTLGAHITRCTCELYSARAWTRMSRRCSDGVDDMLWHHQAVWISPHFYCICFQVVAGWVMYSTFWRTWRCQSRTFFISWAWTSW